MSAVEPVRLRLYVAGDGPNSQRALTNLRSLCEEHFPDCHEVEIIDILREPQRAFQDGVLLTPTLVRLSPSPVVKIVGTLSQRGPLLDALELSLSGP